MNCILVFDMDITKKYEKMRSAVSSGLAVANSNDYLNSEMITVFGSDAVSTIHE